MHALKICEPNDTLHRSMTERDAPLLVTCDKRMCLAMETNDRAIQSSTNARIATKSIHTIVVNVPRRMKPTLGKRGPGQADISNGRWKRGKGSLGIAEHEGWASRSGMQASFVASHNGTGRDGSLG